MKLYKAILHTEGKTPKQIKEESKDWVGSITEEDISRIIQYNNILDGCEVIVVKSFCGEGYTLAAWDEGNTDIDGKIKEAIYLLEQDDLFGSYINERDRFDNDWGNGEYCPDGSITFATEEVEILEPIAEPEEGS